MISTLTGAGAGPVNGYLARGEGISIGLKLYSRRKNALAITAIAGPSLTTSDLYKPAFSDNANYLVVPSGTVSSVGLRIYQRSGSTFSALSIPGGSLNTTFSRVSISSSGEYFVANTRVYHNNAGSITFLETVSADILSISPSGEYLAGFVSPGSPAVVSLQIHKRSGSGNSATYPVHQTITLTGATYNVQAVAFSHDGTYIAAVFSLSSGRVTRVYKYNAGTDNYDDLSQPPSGGTQIDADTDINGIAWSPDSSMLAVATTAKTFFYEKSSDTFTYRAALSGSGDGFAGSWHPSGNYYITGDGRLYRKVSPSSYTFLQQVGGNNGRAATFSPSLT